MLTLVLGAVAGLLDAAAALDAATALECAECAPNEPETPEELCSAFSGPGSIGGEGPHDPGDLTREDLEEAVGGPDAGDLVEEMITRGGPSKGFGADPMTASEAFFKGLDTACDSDPGSRYGHMPSVQDPDAAHLFGEPD